VTFTEFFDGPLTKCGWFAEDTWSVWRVTGKAIFGEKLNKAEREIFTRFTGRTMPPTSQVKELWAIVGRRGGKGSFVASICIYLSLIRPPVLKRGVLARVLVLAVDKDQAGEVFSYVESLVEMLGYEDKVIGHTKESIEFSTGVEVLIKPADKRRVRGRSLVTVVADEVASWWDDTSSSNPAREVFRALRPSMLGVKGALLMAISSPYSRSGLLYETCQAAWGKDGDRRLVWRAATWEQRPSDDPDFLQFLAEEEADDPLSYRSEYGAQWRSDLESFLTVEAIDAVTITGRNMLGYLPGVKHYAFGDFAGGVGTNADSATLAIGRVENGKLVRARMEEWKPPFDAIAMVKDVHSICQEYHIREVVADHFSAGTFDAIFKEHAKGLKYTVHESTTTKNYVGLIPLLSSRVVELLDHAKLRGQLLSLERRTKDAGGETISHPKNPQAHDDLATACAGLFVLLNEANKHFDPIVSHYTRTTARQISGTDTGKGAEFIGGTTGDVFRAPSGELFRDPRGL